MAATDPIDRRSLDLATLATPGTIGRPGRLYGSVRDSRGLCGRRYFIAALPAGAAVFPLAAPGVAFMLIEEDGSPDGPWFVAGIPPAPSIDAWYGAQIAKYTTAPDFNTILTNYLPASTTVPTPAKVLGDVSGAPNHRQAGLRRCASCCGPKRASARV